MQHTFAKCLPALALSWVLTLHCRAACADPEPETSIPSTALISPADFAASLKAATLPQLLILHVGFRKLYDQAHIPGSEYVGAARESEGLQALRERVASLPRDTPVVIYCGCCPWNRCPNIAAAYDVLHELGFTRLKALHIAGDFGTDWVDKGYPTARNDE